MLKSYKVVRLLASCRRSGTARLTPVMLECPHECTSLQVVLGDGGVGKTALTIQVSFCVHRRQALFLFPSASAMEAFAAR